MMTRLRIIEGMSEDHPCKEEKSSEMLRKIGNLAPHKRPRVIEGETGTDERGYLVGRSPAVGENGAVNPALHWPV